MHCLATTQYWSARTDIIVVMVVVEVDLVVFIIPQYHVVTQLLCVVTPHSFVDNQKHDTQTLVFTHSRCYNWKYQGETKFSLSLNDRPDVCNWWQQ